MQTAADRIVRAAFWGFVAGPIAGGIGGYVAGLVQGDTWVCLLDCLYVSATTVAIFTAAMMFGIALILGIVVGLVTGAINRPKLTWLLGLLLGALTAILFHQGFDTSAVLVLAVSGLISAIVAGWRMTPKPAARPASGTAPIHSADS